MTSVSAPELRENLLGARAKLKTATAVREQLE
jgi:hypothetical protein